MLFGSEGGTVPVPERDAAFGWTHPEGVGGGLFIRVQPVFLRHGRNVHDQVEVVVHANTGGSKYAIIPISPNEGDPKEPI